MNTRRTSRSRTCAVVLATLITLAGCSSTNDRPPAGALDNGASPSATPVPVPTAAGGTPLTREQIAAEVKAGKLPASALSATPSSGGAVTGGGTTAGSGTTGTGTTGVKPGTSTKRWSGPVGPGITATTIKIGISTFKIGDFAKNLGVNVDVGDNEAQAHAVIDYVNARGGIGGRKVLPSFFEVDFSQTGGTDGALEAAACEQWTQDDKVFAAINLSLQRQQLLACLAKKDVLGVHNGIQIDEARMSPYRKYYYGTQAGSGVIQDRAARTENAMLCGKGWFKGATVGIIYFDEPAMRHIVDKIYEPEIKACGGKKVVKQAAGRGLTTADSTYVARFQQEGVTNVMFLAEGGSYPYTFMPAAENQLYRPKYSLRSDHAPSIQLSAAQVPPAQLRNAIGIGWSPMQDTNAAGDPGPTNAADRLCLEIFKKASISMADRGARLAAMSMCSGLLFLQQAVNGTTSITSTGVAESVAKLGRSFVPPGSFSCAFTARQHDCQDTYREIAYDVERKAFKYVSGKKPMAKG